MYNRGRLLLVKTTMETMRGIYRMKDINPLAIFKVRGERLDIDDRLTNFFFR
jgi:uncharacterized protein YxjI